MFEWLVRVRVRSDGVCRGSRRLRGEVLDVLRFLDLRCFGDGVEEEEEELVVLRFRGFFSIFKEEDGAVKFCSYVCVCVFEFRYSGCEG